MTSSQPQQNRVVIKPKLMEVLRAVVEHELSVDTIGEAANWVIADWAKAHADELGLAIRLQRATVHSQPTEATIRDPEDEASNVEATSVTARSTRRGKPSRARSVGARASQVEPSTTKEAIQNNLKFLSEI